MFQFHSCQFIFIIGKVVFQIMPLLACNHKHFSYMSMNKKGSYITNIIYTAIILNGHVDPAVL